MRMLLQRLPSANGCTLGELTIDGQHVCWTLEDIVRPAGEKVAGKTAIAAGVYQITINRSTRFKCLLPLLLDVPGFTGVRIHPGNTQYDTEGCILVGRHKKVASVEQSRAAFDPLMSRLNAAQANREAIYIEIRAAE